MARLKNDFIPGCACSKFCFSWFPSRIPLRLGECCNLYHGLSRSRLKYKVADNQGWWPILHSYLKRENIFRFVTQFLCRARRFEIWPGSHASCWNWSQRLTNISRVGPGHCTQIIYSLSTCRTFNCFKSDHHACSSVLRLATLPIRLISHASQGRTLGYVVAPVPRIVLEVLNGFFAFVLSRVTFRDCALVPLLSLPYALTLFQDSLKPLDVLCVAQGKFLWTKLLRVAHAGNVL